MAYLIASLFGGLRRSGVSGLAVALALASVGACSNPSDVPDGEGACTNCMPAGPMTFALPSPPGAKVWTTPTMEKVLLETAVPTTTGDAITLYAARNEYEPFQVV